MRSDELIREIRRKYALQQRDLAQILNVPSQTLSRWERGQAEPSSSVLCLISFYFQIPLAECLDYERIVKPHRSRRHIIQELARIRDGFVSDSPFDNLNREALSENARNNYHVVMRDDADEQNRTFNELKHDANLTSFRVRHNNYQPWFMKGDELFFAYCHDRRHGFALIPVTGSSQAYEVVELEHSQNRLLVSHLDTSKRARHTDILLGNQARDLKIVGFLEYLVRSYS